MTQDKGHEQPEGIEQPTDLPDEDLPEYLQSEPAPAGEETEEIQRVVPLEEPATEPAAEAPQEPAPMPVIAPVETEPVKRSKGRRAALIALAAVIVLAGAYAGTAWYFADRVPMDTTVAGVDISGLSSEDAVTRLTTELGDVMTDEISVALGESESSIDPVAAGLDVDIEGTVDELVGFSLEPASVFGHLFGKGEHEAIIRSDTELLSGALVSIEENLNVAPVEGELILVDGELETTDPEDGLAVDIDASVDHIIDQWLQGPRPVELPGVVDSPTMDAEKIEQAKRNVVDPLFSGDVPLTINDETVTVSKDAILKVATLHPAGNSYEVHLEQESLLGAVNDLLPGLGQSPKDASFAFEGGKPVIVPSVTGTGINPETLAAEFSTAVVRTGEERKVVLELEATEPDFTTKDAEALGIKERVSHFKTPVPYDPPRTKNLVNGAKKLTGILVKPGETFSLIEALGPIDAAHGYVASGVVINGFADTAMGGGLSQMSTTVFNAAFEAGMEDVFHQPHSRYFTRYPEGREATMFAPDLDMKWKNNTPYGVLVQSWIDDDAHVALWSTKHWDTKITTGPRTNFTSPQTIYNTSPGCTPESGGSSGFTVSIQRVVSKDGVRNDQYSRSYSHTYQPWNHVVCGSKPKPESKTSDSSSDSED